MGNIQVFQAVHTYDCGALQNAGLPALPHPGFPGQPDTHFVGCLPQCADVCTGSGLGEQPPH